MKLFGLASFVQRRPAVDDLVQAINFLTLQGRWNALVARINKLGGEEFLQRAEAGRDTRLTRDDIRTLVKLCHPDKHGGSEDANKITAKLLAMR